jgi:hypothetical protein
MVHQVGKFVVGGDGEPSGQAPQARMAAFASMAILHAKPGPIGDGMPRTANKAGGQSWGPALQGSAGILMDRAASGSVDPPKSAGSDPFAVRFR